MALSDDQKAMLRLLAQREQGYEDIAALMGLSVGEVRAKVKDALAQLEDEGAEPPPLPPQAAVPPEPEPAPPAPSQTSPPPPPSRPSGRPGIGLPSSSGARAALAAGLAVVALVVVVLIVGGGGRGDSTGSTATTTTEGSTEARSTTPASNAKEVTKAVLGPVGGGSASGVATFGRVKNKLALQIEAAGLEPTAQGEAYTVWLAQSANKMLPLASTQASSSGQIGAQFEVPTEVLAYLANETFDQIVVSKTRNSLLKAALAKAASEKKAPVYTGTAVLRGTVTGPIVGAALRQEEKK